MESPINPDVWRYIFNASIGILSGAALYSVYHQKFDMHSTMNETFRRLRESNEGDQEKILHEILARLQSDSIKKVIASRLSSLDNGALLVQFLKLERDGSNASTVSIALKVVLRVFGVDASSRCRLHKFGGFKVLLATLSEAHRQGNQDLMEESAETLRSLTKVDDSEVILDSDVPEGSEGAYALAQMPATVKMLRILDPESSVLFLNALTGIFANVCTLNAGAVSLAKGTDGHRGISFFFRLLDHSNQSVIENCVMVIRFMARAKVGHEEIALLENVTRLQDNLRLSADPQITNAILTIILMMASSSSHKKDFFTHVAGSSIPNKLFDIWIRSPEKQVRSRAEVLCRLMMRIEETMNVTTTLFVGRRSEIEERHQKDQQEYQRQMQQMQQNQFMQRMMMEQMGMDPSMMME